MSVSYGGDTITFADSSVVSSGWTGFKNRLINGAINIDQRVNTAITLANTGAYYYCSDRWMFYQDTTGLVGTVRPSSTAPAGFSNSIAVTVTTGNTSSAGHQNIISQWIEGVHTQDLAWGTASAAPVTLSFWVRSSITGTNGGMISNSAYDRNYTFSYTVNSANTWEYKTVTIPGDTSGTWTAGAGGTSIRLRFNYGSGANYLGATGTWSSGIYNGPTGSFSTTGTSGATLYFAGIQLERGSSASSFEYRPYPVELMMCQRYYYQYTNTGLSDQPYFRSPYVSSPPNSSASIEMYFPVTMRIAPTVNGILTGGTLNRQTASTGFVVFQMASSSGASAYAASSYTASAELT